MNEAKRQLWKIPVGTDKDGLYGFQIIGIRREFTYGDDGKLLTTTENEDRQGKTSYTFTYDDMGNRTSFDKVVRGKKAEVAEYTYDVSGEMTFGKPQYNNVYSYNAESYNPNMEPSI